MMTSTDVIRQLRQNRFARIGVRGSHHKLRNAAGVVVPHPKKDLGKAFLTRAALEAMAKDAA